MIITEWVEAKWNPKTKKRYEELGYKYTKMGHPFLIKITDVSPWNKSQIEVECDYCGSVYETTLEKRTSTFSQRGTTKKDVCRNNICVELKIKESNNRLFGADSFLESEEGKKKMNSLVMERYGVENVFQLESVKEKIKNRNKGIHEDDSTCIEYHSSEENLIRTSRAVVNWKKEVFSRDDNTCQCCGLTNTKMNAHHIMNFSDYPDMRDDIDNGITLCEKCHIQFHKVYGKRKTNHRQLSEFLNSHG